MFWTFKKSFDVDVEKLGDFCSKNLVTLEASHIDVGLM